MITKTCTLSLNFQEKDIWPVIRETLTLSCILWEKTLMPVFTEISTLSILQEKNLLPAITYTSTLSFHFAGQNPFSCDYGDFYFELAFCKRKTFCL